MRKYVVMRNRMNETLKIDRQRRSRRVSAGSSFTSYRTREESRQRANLTLDKLEELRAKIFPSADGRSNRGTEQESRSLP